ncbi:hypothetical protein [Microcoleus sp. FACHB-1515]|uniref:hypothetical protein n=1 Tax=Microcoleus sp. FACHB-1515 TaxID=2692821 RepID=UPI001A7EF9CC|nr:hypothetical protein [Microcoleus sp. FACHB-1515]
MKITTAVQTEISDLQNARSQFKQTLRRKIQIALWTAQTLPAEACLCEIRNQLIAIQNYCDRHQKKFIFVEELISCNQFDLGGSDRQLATLFRGPSEDASVAICVTEKGSLLHRNSCPWIVYRNTGDIARFPTATFCLL